MPVDKTRPVASDPEDEETKVGRAIIMALVPRAMPLPPHRGSPGPYLPAPTAKKRAPERLSGGGTAAYWSASWVSGVRTPLSYGAGSLRWQPHQRSYIRERVYMRCRWRSLLQSCRRSGRFADWYSTRASPSGHRGFGRSDQFPVYFAEVRYPAW